MVYDKSTAGALEVLVPPNSILQFLSRQKRFHNKAEKKEKNSNIN